MPGTVKQFVDFSNNTNNDTGENTAASIQPIANGEAVNQTVLQRPSESLRQRTEAVRNIETDSLFLRDADRNLVIAGPGKVTWPGSTTVAQTGIPVITDNLYILPMLTPGFAQTPPLPPVASVYGTLHLKRASDSMNSVLVTSIRRSYAAGDQINIQVTSGGSFSCVLDLETGYQRTVKIVATPSTSLSVVIAALNALLPAAPDNTQLVSAALEGGALGTDLLLTTQAKQYVAGNYDGEGHTITPANLASFFISNPTQALAEGDTLCVNFPMVSDTASTGGRRQAIPENTNTAIPAGAFFNSRVHPENLVNALPICKVINGSLVFGTGSGIAAGSTSASINNTDAASITYAGGGAWADGITNPATSVENQFDKIISDLATGAGTAKLLGSAIGSEVVIGTLAAQLSAIVARTMGWLTVGNGTTVIGDFNTSAYPNANALLIAALAALPASGGRIFLKRGVALTNFNGTPVAMPAGKTVEIFGDHSTVPLSTPQITFTTGESFTCSPTGKLILRNLSIRQAAPAGGVIVTLTTAPFEAYDVFVENTGTTNAANDNAMFQGTNVTDLHLERVRYNTTAIPNSVFSSKGLVYISGTAYRIFMKNVRGTNTGGDGAGLIQMDDIRNDVVMEDIIWDQTGSIGAAGVTLASQDFTTDIRNRHLVRYAAKGEYALAFTDGCTYLDIEEMDDRTNGGLAGNITNGATGPLRFINCQISSFQNWNGSQDDLQFRGCDFRGLTQALGSGSDSHNKITFSKCRFFGGNFGSITITCDHIRNLLVEECYFHNYSNTSNPNSAVFFVNGGVGSHVWIRFLRNRIDAWQNVNYTGGDAVNSLRFFDVRAQSISLVECSGNLVTGVMEAFSGNTIASAYLLRVDNYVASDSSSPSGEIRMHDNVVGTQTGTSSSNCGLLYCPHMIFDLVDIRRNQMWTEWNTAAGQPHAVLGFGVYLQYNNSYSGTGKQGFIFDDNFIRVENTSVADITKDLIFIQALGVPTLQLFSFQRNKIHMSVNRRWDQASGWGCLIEAPFFLTCMVCENSTARDGANAPGGAGTPFFAIYHTTFAFGYFPTHAPPPAVNTAWDSNVYIWRGPV
jgi:hypothetical protein